MCALRLGMAGAQEGGIAGAVSALFESELEQEPGAGRGGGDGLPLPALRVGLAGVKRQWDTGAVSEVQKVRLEREAGVAIGQTGRSGVSQGSRRRQGYGGQKRLK